jgi:NADH-quinone oxidoreductase subunit G
MITLSINSINVSVPEETTVLEAAIQANIHIPTLCHMEGLEDFGGCRLCVVEIIGEPKLVPSCVRKVSQGMVVNTNTPRTRHARKVIIELLLADHATFCPSCERSQHCDLQKLAYELGVTDIRFENVTRPSQLDQSSPSIVRDPNKCIYCGRCVRVCKQIQGVYAIDFMGRGTELSISTVLNRGLGNVECVNCGQCIHVCPVGAIKEKSSIEDVWAAIANPNKHVVVQEAPSVRVGLGEELGFPTGSLVSGKMYAALRLLGFDAVFDTNFSADLTIMEEASELIERINENGVLPQITSCCPGWIKFAEHFYPDLLPHVSTCKSPQQMFGALAKTYYAKEAGINPGKIVSVSVMPCTAKKFEALRPEMKASGFQDVDYVLTTRELSRMIKEAGIDFKSIPDQQADYILGQYTGAATIFGASGGVMEAALRTAYKLITGNELDNLDIKPLRGLQGIKEASVDINGLKVNVAVAHGLSNARLLMDQIKNGKSPYHFIEIMACPGGCVGGGGQPLGFDMEIRGERGNSLYDEDKHLPCRRSHENQALKKLYQDFLGSPLGDLSHELLHTVYTSRKQ